MPVLNFTYIDFDLRNWEDGYFISMRLPFSRKNYEAVVAFPNSACIKLIK